MSMGGGGGGGGQTTSTSYQTNIPEYAKPYVETMLGATQQQLFNGSKDEEGNFNITGFKPYQPYSTNPSDYIAGFSPLQQQAQQTIGSMQVPGQFQTASDITSQGIMGAANVGQQGRGLLGMGMQAANAGNQYANMATNPYATAAYMSPYMQDVVDVQQREAGRQSEIQRVANQGQATQAGAFGGGRQAVMEAERQRNLGTQQAQIQAQGLQSAYDQAQKNQQFGAGLGLQGMQTGAGIYGQGIGAQQAGINQMMQGAGQYAGLGAQELQAQQGIANLQNTVGAQQQSLEQQKVNQAIQDYSNAQQYPLMQLGTMSNMLRGLPMQASTTNQYVAAPNPITQGIGTAGAAASIYNATKAEGGVIKSMAKGGITSVPSYDVGGSVKGQLADMDISELEKQARESTSPAIREMAKEILREKKMAQTPQGAGPTGPMGVDYQAPQLAGGGIIAFAEPEKENNYSLVKERDPKIAPSFDENPAGGILGNASTLLAKKPPMTAERAIPTTTDLSGTGDPMSGVRKSIAAQQRIANTPTEELAAEAETAAGPNVAAQDLRAKVMAERANSEDEAKRQRWMRAAQFFAKWGSTPGPVLVAGMNALDAKLPDIIGDEKEYKKMKREIDRTIFELDNADRLEKKGFRKEAIERKDKAANIAMHLEGNLSTYLGGIEREKIQAAGNLEREKEHSKARMAEVGQRASAQADQKNELLLAAAARDLNEARQKIANRNSKDEQAQKDATAVTMYNTQLSNAEGDPSKVSAYIKNEYEQAQKRIKARNENDSKLEKLAEDNYARIHKKVTGLDYSGSNIDTGAGGGGGGGGGAPTSMTMADVEATAKASGRSVDEVKAAAKAKGIAIK